MHRSVMFAMLLFALASNVVAAADVSASEQVLRDFGEDGYKIWASTEGQLTGDDIPDFAAVLERGSPDGNRREILAVYAGTANGFELISNSGQYCSARNWYNLDASGGSLFVEAVTSISTSITSNRLQFRYDDAAKDFRIIGEEYASESDEIDDTFRGSVNHLTGEATFSRVNAAGRKEVARRFELPATLLSGFDCTSWEYGRGQHVYIDTDLSVVE
ncbi:MAG: hypothetical protein IPK97_11165 [Ahniella sp.]|nr:hypothetical protein [Ahniella sp.]